MSKQRSRVLVVDETTADGTTAIHSLVAQAPDVRSSLLNTSRTKHA
jgi:hypothetical protein